MAAKIETLKHFLRMISKEGIVLAYSGGTDSAFLLQIFRDLLEESPFPFHAVMMLSVFQKKDELSAAEKFAEKRGIPLTILPYDPFQVPEIRNNSKLRCYYCKKLFFAGIRLFADSKGCRTVIDGTNLDDLGEYRPGHRALQEAGVFSPLAENGFSKREIRQFSREMNLETADLPAAPCLATRFPYDTELTPQKIELAEKGEKIIAAGIPEKMIFRLRFLPEKTVIEAEEKGIPFLKQKQTVLIQELRNIGCPAPEIDLSGYRSGRFDQAAKAENIT